MGALIFVLGCAIPAALLFLFSRPTRDETDNEYMDRIFTHKTTGRARLRQRVPEHGYSKRRTTRRRKTTRR